MPKIHSNYPIVKTKGSWFYDLTGHRFGKLIALKIVGRDRGSLLWECRCDCGSLIQVRTSPLVTGHTKSCGCARWEDVTAHGKTLIIADWATLTGINRRVIAKRLDNGWSMEDAVSRPIRHW